MGRNGIQLQVAGRFSTGIIRRLLHYRSLMAIIEGRAALPLEQCFDIIKEGIFSKNSV